MSIITNEVTNTMEPPSIANLEFELIEFSDEILLDIFSNFNDIDLLNAAQVCRRFKLIAKEVFAKKYNGDSDDKYYEILVSTHDSIYDQKLYRMFLKMFGSEIKAINLNMEQRSHQQNFMKLISQQCRCTKHVIIFNNTFEFNITNTIKLMTNLTTLTLKNVFSMNFHWADCRYPQLERFHAEDVLNMDVEVLKQFLYINPQIKHLRVLYCNKFPLAVIQALRDKLKGLISLEYVTDKNNFIHNCRDINMTHLEELKISVDGTSFQNVIEAIARGSKMIQRLDVLMSDTDINVDAIHAHVVNIIPQFKHLTSLCLNQFDLGFAEIRTLICYMPNFVSLNFDGVKIREFTSYEILYIFRRCKQLKKLSLGNNDHAISSDEFNVEFHRKFAEIVRNRGNDVQFEFNYSETKVKITPKKIVKNDTLLYWTECEDSQNCSTKFQFFDLGEKCLKIIYNYLDEQSERALYETCTRTKHAMQDRIKSQLFTVSDLFTAKDMFSRFGEHIMKLAIDLKINNHDETARTWKYIGEKYNEKITELSLINIKVDAIDSVKLNFSNLTTLKIMSVVSSAKYIFPQMECPKLSHLEFNVGDISLKAKPRQFGISFNQLTHINLKYFSNSIGKILHTLHSSICDQIEEITVEHVDETIIKQKSLINLIMRFHNLITLNFIPYGIENTNTKYLFQTCTKLVNLSLGVQIFNDLDKWRKMLKIIKENCKHLTVIRLVHEYIPVEPNLQMEIMNWFPNAKLINICFVTEFKYYIVEPYRKLTKADRDRPY